jgi:chromosome segregation ATPase
MLSQSSPQRSLSPSVGSRAHYGGNGDSENDNDDGNDDNSLDTYVSVSTKGGKSYDESSIYKGDTIAQPSSSRREIFRDDRPKSTRESSRVLQETSHATNKSMISRSSSTSSVVKKMKNQYEGYGGKSSSSVSSNSEILGKLKSDINSLAFIRSQTHEDYPERYSENDFSRLRSTSSFASSSPGRLRDSRNDHGRSHSAIRSSQYDGAESHNYGGNVSRSQSSVAVASRGHRVESDRADIRSTSSLPSSSPARLHDSRSNIARSKMTVKSSQCDGVKSNGYGDNDERPQSSVASRFDRVEPDRTDARSNPSIPTRARSVERTFRVNDAEGATRNDASSVTQQPRPRLWENLKKKENGSEMAAENNELLKQLQETVRTLKEESESKMSDFIDIRSQLDKSKSKEEELARALRVVVSNVEGQQSVTSEELSIVYKLRESEVILLKEKLNGALAEVAAKTAAIQNMQSDMTMLQRSCQQDMEETQQRLYDEMNKLDNKSMKKVTKLQHHLEESELDYKQLNEKTTKILDQLSKSESENRMLRESLSKTKEDAEQAVAAVKQLLDEAKEEKKEEILTLRDSFLVAKEEAQAAHEKTSNLKQSMDKMEEENNRLELALAETNVAKVNMELELNSIKGELDILTNSKIPNIEDEKRRHAAQIEKLETNLSESKAEHVKSECAFKTSMDKAKETNAQVSANLVKAEQKIGVLNGLLQEREKQLVEMNQVENTMKMKIQHAEDIIDAKERKVSAYKEQLMEVKEEAEKMHAKVRQVEEEYDALKVQVHERDLQLMDRNKEKATLQKKIDDIQREVETYETKVPAYKAKVNRLKTDLGEAQTKAMITENEVSSLQAELVRINEHLEQCEKRASVAQEKESKLNGTIQDLQSKLQMAEMNLERTESSAQERESKLNGTAQDLRSELQNVRKNLERAELGAEERESKLNDTIQDLQSELDITTKNLEQADAKLSNLRKEGDARKGQLKSALQSLDEMMAYITAMQSENDGIVASLESDLDNAIKMKQDVEKDTMKR